MKFSEIAPPGREKQVKKLKKKFDDPGAPYAIAWAQHNKHGKPNKNEGRMSDIDADIKTLSDQEFQKKYSKSKEQMKKDLNESTEYNTIKAILTKYNIKSTDDIEYGSKVYDELFGYYMDSGEMPYGVMKARTGMPDEWIVDRIDDLNLLKQVNPLQKKTVKQNTPSKLKNISNKIEKPKLQKKQSNNTDKSDNTGSNSTMTVGQAFKKGYGESTDVEEAPFGAVKKAMNTAKRVAGVVPGLGDMGQQAKGEKAIGDVANKVWQKFQQFKASDPNDEQVINWFEKNYKVDVAGAVQQPGELDQNKVLQAVKTQYAKDKSGAAGDTQQNTTPNTQPGSNDQTDAKSNDLKVQMSLLKKIAPEVEPSPALRAIKTMASGKPVNPNLQQVITPIMKKVARALTQPSKTTMLQRALAESLSQTDLSKLDMLAREGMVPKNRVARFKTAMRTLAKGKDLPISYKDDVIEVVMKLAKIITKPSVMGMVRKGLREEHTITAQKKFKTWVNQADDIIS